MILMDVVLGDYAASEAIPQTVADEPPAWVSEWRSEQEAYFQGFVFFICMLIGVILASFAWRGD